MKFLKPIVSYCLFGDDEKYFVGAKKNYALIQELLPRWQMTVIYDSNQYDKEKIKELQDLGIYLHDINELLKSTSLIKNPNEFSYFWRFFPLSFSTPCIARDLDSRITDREAEYINRWLHTGRKYFIIRDHPWHSEVPAGLFGIWNADISFMRQLCDYIRSTDIRWGDDQDFLQKFKKSIDLDDLYLCDYGNKHYIPRKDKSLFIGCQLGADDKPTPGNGVESFKVLEEMGL